MITAIKIKLIPNNKQRTKLMQCCDVNRFVYNWTLEKQQENYKNGGKFIQDRELRKEFTQLKKTKEYEWLNKYSNNIPKQAIKDACEAYKRFFKGCSNFPKFKTKKKSKASFYVANDKIKFTSTHVKLEKISLSTKKNKARQNWIRLAEYDRIPANCTYYNPRVTFDGLNFWISVGIENSEVINTPINNGIGIDLGIKDLAICSDGNIYKNINKSTKVKRIEKRKCRLQRKLTKKYNLNKNWNDYHQTNNIKKLEKQLLKVTRKLTNIRHDYLHQVTTEIINREPIFICLETLDVKGMMKNKYLAKAIQEQSFYEFKKLISYKAAEKNIYIIEAPRFYPSSKTCSECGAIKQDLKLSDRKYKCTECGCVMDRDFNASINLMKYGQSIVDSL